MFTGLITEIGAVRRRTRAGRVERLTIAASQTAECLRKGDSVAVAGACLTVESAQSREFTCAVIPETMRATRLNHIRGGDHVNLELPLTVESRLDGHLVSGHVDTVGKIVDLQRSAAGGSVQIAFADEFRKWIVEKGSIAVDGVSLTIAQVSSKGITVGIIPTTWNETTIGDLRRGDLVNLEFDQAIKAVVGKSSTDRVRSKVLTEKDLFQAGW